MLQITPKMLAERLQDAQRPAPLLLDVREPWEVQICQIPGSVTKKADIVAFLKGGKAAPDEQGIPTDPEYRATWRQGKIDTVETAATVAAEMFHDIDDEIDTPAFRKRMVSGVDCAPCTRK